MGIPLTPDQVQLFKNALLDALAPGELEQVVSLGLKEEYAKLVPDGNRDRQVFELVQYVNRRNMVEQLLDAALTANPGNTKLKEFASTIGRPLEQKQVPFDSSEPNVVDTVRQKRQDIQRLREHGQQDLAEDIFYDTDAWYQTHSSLFRPSRREEEEEYALLRLEHLYLEWGKWCRAQVRAEDLIKRFQPNVSQGMWPVLLYVVGRAYNVLGISLHMQQGESRLAKSPRDALNRATKTLNDLDILDVKDVRTKIKINYAGIAHEEGNCDDAIYTLETLKSDVCWDEMPTKQKAEAEYNLAEAYLDRGDDSSITLAGYSADMLLTRAIGTSDLEEWGHALKLKLDALCTSVRAAGRADERELAQVAARAQTLYDEYEARQRSGPNKDEWEISDVKRTLQRSLVQIRALTRDTDGAKSVLEALVDSSLPEPQDFREIADTAMTKAIFHEQQGYWELALHELEEARRNFGYAHHTGWAVDSLLEMARLNLDHGRNDEARNRLREARELAKNLGCKSRRARVDRLLKQVGD